MELDKDIKQQLAGLLAEPHLVCNLDVALLKELLQEYPYYQPLHLLLAKVNKQNEDESNTLAKASLYTNGQLLHDFLFDKTNKKADFNIIGQATEIIKDTPLAEEQENITGDDDTINEAQDIIYQEQGSIDEEDVVEQSFDENEDVIDADQDADAEKSNTIADEQETFDEITEIDLSQYRPFKNSNGQTPAPEIEGQETMYRKTSLEDDFVFESIASSDFFAFEEKFSTDTTADMQSENHHDAPAGTDHPIETDEEKETAEQLKTENSQLSNYNDEKLPYTFLWWLAKTRKEHQSIFQPYATPKKAEAQELQQQYVEHIFHVQSHLTGSDTLLENEDKDKPVTKDFEIIENFIRKDPQITPPNAEQIDNENKAKKSAEDQNDLVSETLANIYIEQMLYDKAIDTYQKLSLKFPEKSRYFADLIQSIEKKI